MCSFFNRGKDGTVWHMDDLTTIVTENVFLSITCEPIVPSSEFRAEQFSSLGAVW